MLSSFYNPATHLLDGKGIAEAIKGKLKQILQESTLSVGLAVIRVGDDPASHVYVTHKQKACEAIGIRSHLHHLPSQTSQNELRDLIHALNHDPHIHGILLQLPLPSPLDPFEVIDHIAPEKDIDGLTAVQQGRLVKGRPDIIPCTPRGCLSLLHHVYPSLKGLTIGVVGRSTIVGRPLATLLTSYDATVLHAHSHTQNLKELLQQMDVIVSATGAPHLITQDHVKEGATVIDVGIHRSAKGPLLGDVDALNVRPYVHALTPVPGGVGPMTVACLLANTVRQAARKSDPLSAEALRFLDDPLLKLQDHPT